MSFSILKQIGDAQKKKSVVDVRPGDTVKVTQKIKEGEKFRLAFQHLLKRKPEKRGIKSVSGLASQQCLAPQGKKNNNNEH